MTKASWGWPKQWVWTEKTKWCHLFCCFLHFLSNFKVGVGHSINGSLQSKALLQHTIQFHCFVYQCQAEFHSFSFFYCLSLNCDTYRSTTCNIIPDPTVDAFIPKHQQTADTLSLVASLIQGSVAACLGMMKGKQNKWTKPAHDKLKKECAMSYLHWNNEVSVSGTEIWDQLLHVWLHCDSKLKYFQGQTGVDVDICEW
jgi:hypothetical protein